MNVKLIFGLDPPVRYNIEIRKLECKERDAVCTATSNFAALNPALRVLLVGKRLNSKKETYDDIARLNGDCSSSVQVHFPLIDWTDDDVRDFFSSLCLPCNITET